jgi:hypothetical protein
MDTIEANDGLYPLNGGRVTVGEVLLRAKKSQGYLRKTKDQPELAELRSDVDAFVDRVAKAFARGAKSVRKLVTERADEAQEGVRKIRQAWVEAELEHNETRITACSGACPRAVGCSWSVMRGSCRRSGSV